MSVFLLMFQEKCLHLKWYYLTQPLLSFCLFDLELYFLWIDFYSFLGLLFASCLADHLMYVLFFHH